VVGAAAIAAIAVALRPSVERARASLATSSSPGAGWYDLVAGVALGGYYDDIARDGAALLAGVPSASILEIGPGPGHLAERLLASLPDARWTGLDIDADMLEHARRRAAAGGFADRSETVQGDVAALPFPGASFDLVVSSLSAHHWPDAEGGFREIRRVLRPGQPALVYDLPATWAHAETGSRGIAAAADAFDAPVLRRARGIGPWTIVWRVEGRA
jgi:ubiquinone/menaquinone biosynthesis C-methylase UbiE